MKQSIDKCLVEYSDKGQSHANINASFLCCIIWRKDWSESITVEATVQQVKKFAHQIRKIVGKDFMFELSLQTEKPEYFIDDKNGLISYEN